MKPSDALGSLDTYSLRARLYPALIATLPFALLSTLVPDKQPFSALVPLLLSAGMLFLVANIVRARGRRAERRLRTQWDGMPTTRMLRFRDAGNPVLLDQRRRSLEDLIGRPLPTRRQENADPVKADQAYEAAVRRLIAWTRSRPGQFSLLEHENVTYGFARNLLGVKPVALAVLAAAGTADLVIAWRAGPSTGLIAVGGVHLALSAVWLLFIRPAWVEQSAQTYAERLFDTLDQPAVDAGPAGDDGS